MPAIRFIGTRSAASLVALMATAAAARAASVQDRLQENWRAEIANTPAPAPGCFKAQYPSKAWVATGCIRAPHVAYIPRHLTGAAGGRLVGNGTDYAATAHGLITSAVGSFPAVIGLKTESDGGANVYSLQLNSNFFASTVCSGASNPANCLGWEQFVYSSSSQASFIQYWLINYGTTCPTTPYNDWNQFQGSCYRNSAAVAVPQIPATSLKQIKISGTAGSKSDSFVTTYGTTAYRTGGNDNVVALATGWSASEYNVVGDGGGSAASFNPGTRITVRIAQHDGTTLAPACTANAGTTGETNNLNLGACTATSGTKPAITFAEHN